MPGIYWLNLLKQVDWNKKTSRICGSFFYYDRMPIIRSVKNTPEHPASATTIRLLFRNARMTAIARPTAPLIMFSVVYKMAGKVMAVKQATGT